MAVEATMQNPRREFSGIRRILTVALLLLTAAYVAKGFYYLLFKDPSDLHMKWIDEQYIFKGQNPFDVYLHQLDVGAGSNLVRTNRNAQVDPEIGPTWAAGYPPWFYFPGLAIFRPHWQVARALFALLDVLALVFIAIWILREYASIGCADAWFLLAAALAISGICNTIEIGQYGLLMMGLLGAALWAERYDRWVIAGLCLGLCTSKPTVGAVFVLAWLVKMRWKSLTVAAVYLGVATTVICAMVKTGPLEMMSQLEMSSRSYLHEAYDLTVMVSNLGVQDVLASRIVAFSCLVIALAVMVPNRKKSLLFHCSVAAILGRLATYHHLYDNIMLMPLVMYVALAWIERGGVAMTIILAVLGATLWAPEKLLEPKAMRIAQILIYAGSLAAVLLVEHFGNKPSVSPQPPNPAIPAGN